MSKKIVIIGGSAAGAKAAAKARRIDPNAEIAIIQKDHDLSQASCGFPYYIGGTFENRKALIAAPYGVVRDSNFFLTTKNIKALADTEVTAINRTDKNLSCKELASGNTFTVEYDTLIYCTGARAKMFPVSGIEQQGVTTLLSMEDTDFLYKEVVENKAERAVVVGGGLIGVEACEALVERGVQVTLVEAASQILLMIDPQLAALMANHMRSKGVDLRLGTKIESYEGDGKITGVRLESGEVIPCDLAVVSTGVQPNVELAKEAGIALGELGGIAVNEFMQTSDPAIFAAGDCVECVNRISGKKVMAPMGDLANLQGRVAGENAALGINEMRFPGTTQTGICKLFAWSAGVTGLTEKQAERFGLDGYETVVTAGPDKPGFMGAGILINKMVADKKSGQILGFQCVGAGDVGREVAAMSLAVQAKMTVDQLSNADMPYAPPFSLAIDNCIATAHVMQNKLKGRFRGISAEEVWKKVQAKEKPLLICGCECEEYKAFTLGIGERVIPIGEFRSHLSEMPQEKDAEIICFCKISLRGYEIALMLEHAGYTNVLVMEGGAMAWPYSKK